MARYKDTVMPLAATDATITGEIKSCDAKKMGLPIFFMTGGAEEEAPGEWDTIKAGVVALIASEFPQPETTEKISRISQFKQLTEIQFATALLPISQSNSVTMTMHPIRR